MRSVSTFFPFVVVLVLLPTDGGTGVVTNGVEFISEPDGLHARVTVDFSRENRSRISPMLFGTNDQEALLPDSHVVGDEEYHKIMHCLGIPLIRLNLGSLHGEYPTRDSEGKFLQGAPYYMDRTLKRPDRRHQQVMLCLSTPPRWVDMHKRADREHYVNQCEKFADFLVNTKGYNITHWELFNEIYNGMEELQKDEERVYWKFYNMLAPRLREIAPGARVGGPALAWADLGVIEDFLKHCGDQVDFVSWHRYPTLSPDEPTPDLMRRTSRYGHTVGDVRRVVRQIIPGRKLQLCLTEYNLNCSWEPHDPRQATAVGACWMASVLKHVADAGLDMGPCSGMPKDKARLDWSAQETNYAPRPC